MALVGVRFDVADAGPASSVASASYPAAARIGPTAAAVVHTVSASVRRRDALSRAPRTRWRLALDELLQRREEEERVAPHAKLVRKHLLQVPRERVQDDALRQHVPEARRHLRVLSDAAAGQPKTRRRG